MKKSFWTLVSAVFITASALAQPKPTPKQQPVNNAPKVGGQPKVNTMATSESAKEYRVIEVFSKYGDISQLFKVEQSTSIAILPSERFVVQCVRVGLKNEIHTIDLTNTKGVESILPTNYEIKAVHAVNSDHVLLETENGFVLFNAGKQHYATKLFGSNKIFIQSNSKELHFYSNHGDFSQLYSIPFTDLKEDAADIDTHFKMIAKTSYELKDIIALNGIPVAATFYRADTRYLARFNNFKLEEPVFNCPIASTFRFSGVSKNGEVYFTSNKENQQETLFKLNDKNTIEPVISNRQLGVEQVANMYCQPRTLLPYFYTTPGYSNTKQILAESSILKEVLSKPQTRVNQYYSSFEGGVEVFVLSGDQLPYELFIYKNGSLAFNHSTYSSDFTFEKSTDILDSSDKVGKQSSQLFLPNGTSSSKYPLILYINDHPFQAASHNFDLQVQSFVSRGFAVLVWNSPLCNPNSKVLFDLKTLPLYASKLIAEAVKKGNIANNEIYCVGVGEGAYHAIYASAGEKSIFKKTFLVEPKFANAMPNANSNNVKQLASASGSSVVMIDNLSFPSNVKFEILEAKTNTESKMLFEQFAAKQIKVEINSAESNDGGPASPLFAKVTRSVTEEAKIRTKLLPTK